MYIIDICCLQLNDKFTAVFLCPTLSKLDGKPTTQLKQNVDRCRNKFLPTVCDYHIHCTTELLAIVFAVV